MRPFERKASQSLSYGSPLGDGVARRVTWIVGLLCLASILAPTRNAFASEAVIVVGGVTSKRLEHDIERALPEGIEAKASRPVDGALKKALRRSPLSKLEEAPASDAPLVKAVRKALRSGKLDMAVLVSVGHMRDVRVLVVPESDDGVPFFRSTTLPKFASAEEHVAWWSRLFEDALPGRTETPEATPAVAEEKPEPAVLPKKEPDAKQSERPPEEAPRRTYFFTLAADAGLRQFSDTETGTGPARSYRAFPLFGFHVDAELYPIASGHVGFEGNYAMAIGVHSKTSDGETIGTNFLRADGALKFRLFTAHRAEAPWLALLVGYGYGRFVFDGSPPNRETPTAVYGMLRLGLDGRAPIDRVALSLGAEYDRLVSVESLGTVTPASSGNGVTAHAGVGIEVASDFFVRLDARYTWLLFGLLRDVPSNVVDQYLTGSLGGELTF